MKPFFLKALKPGDWLVLVGGLLAVVVLARAEWGQGQGDRVVIRAAGHPFAELSLRSPQRVAVPGPLGVTEIEVAQGRVRVARDPGPRQLCVHKGWLSQAGQIAICLPNQVSIQVMGRALSYDSLGY